MKTPSVLQTRGRRLSRRAACLIVVGLASAWATGAEPEDSRAEPAGAHSAPPNSSAAANASASPAAPAESDDSPMMMIEAQFVRATKAQARKAFGASAGAAPITSVLTPKQSKKALQTLARVKADFFSNPTLAVRDGQRAVVEAVREMRYPTQFDPAKDNTDRLVPTAFETRNVGVTLEVEASTKDDVINLNVSPKVVSFLGFIDYGRGKSGKLVSGPDWMTQALKKGMSVGGICQPVFDTRELHTSVAVNPDDTVLLCEMSPGPRAKAVAPDDLRTFVFITVRIPPVKVARETLPHSP